MSSGMQWLRFLVIAAVGEVALYWWWVWLLKVLA
jgi:hypothetical protein